MAFFLRAKKHNVTTGHPFIAILHRDDAKHFGIDPGDRIQLRWGSTVVTVSADVTTTQIRRGYVGIFRDVWQQHPVAADTVVQLTLLGRPKSVQYIAEKLRGKRLTYPKMRSIVADIVNGHLGTIETTYFVAASFAREYTNTELYALTRAMVETGQSLRFGRGPVVDKHSIGGLAGNRTTLLVVPIIASLGLTIPKTSSRAITSPAGTADTMEVLAPVTQTPAAIRRIVRTTGACIVWGGGLALAPADDKIIQVSHPLSLEPYTKMLVSIMAKKVAMGIQYLVIDIPVGEHTKVPNREVADVLASRFRYLARRFHMHIRVLISDAHEPVGKGIGPALEARDALRVLQQKHKRPRDLEAKAIALSAALLELCGKAKRGRGTAMAQDALTSGVAWQKMQEIIRAQGGNSRIDANDITLTAQKFRVSSPRSGVVRAVNNKTIDELARTLGAPDYTMAGIYLHRRIGDRVVKGGKLYTFYAQSRSRMELALRVHRRLQIYRIQ